jgi:protein RecA
MATKETLRALIESVEEKKGKSNEELSTGKTGLGTDLHLDSHVAFGVPSRVPMIDLALGRPGYPAGRIVELFGLPSTGKTTAAYHALAQCQKMGGTAVLIDTERTFEVERAEACGIDAAHLLVTEANDIEEIFQKIESMLDAYAIDKEASKNPIVFAVDSITAVETRTGSERDMRAERLPGEDARAIRRGLRRVNSKIADNKAIVIFVNHAINNFNSFGKQSDSAGGFAIKFFSSVRLRFAFISNITEGKKEDKERLGQMVIITNEKNKVGAINVMDFKVALTDTGFNLYDGLFDGFEKMGAIERVNNINYHFLPTKTTFQRKEWNHLIDNYANKEGKIVGIEEFYKFFMKMAATDGYVKPYGRVKNDSGT